MNVKKDVVIVGGGLAGLYAALSLDSSLKIVVFTKHTLEEANSFLAQGGIAAAIDNEDKPEYHLRDTLNAGKEISNLEAINVLVNEAEENIEQLHEFGVEFDRENGKLCLTREGGHSRFRILHIDGDATGKGIMDALIRKVQTRPNISIIENSFCADLIISDNRCVGVKVLMEDSAVCDFYAKAVILAAGGIGMVYGITTNTVAATGDAIAMAKRAGVKITDMEFIQFHPTVFHNLENKRFLISEAVRGEGGILRNINGERFMKRYDERLELAPRDIVARAIFSEMELTKSDHVYIDLSAMGTELIIRRFPNITAKCREYGIDITKEMIPVSPAQHYCMGGIATDLEARTGLAGLYACGETACTGVHGANRLASNSLLEAIVFANRAAKTINSIIHMIEDPKPQAHETIEKISGISCDIEAEKSIIQAAMRKYAGIVRNQIGLKKCLSILDDTEKMLLKKKCVRKEYLECVNILTIAQIITRSALARKKSIGAHYVTDEMGATD